MSDWRRYLLVAGAFLAVLVIATAAFAAHGLDKAAEHADNLPDVPEQAQDHPEADPPDPQVQQNGGEDNHGQCVSAAAHFVAEGLEGWRKGAFVSSVGRDQSMVGEDCDFSEHLEAALAAEGPGGSGVNGEAGQSEGAGLQGPETASSAQGDGRDFGQDKKEEHAPGS